MLGFAVYFFTVNTKEPNLNLLNINIALSPYILGVVANSLNFMQYPFWAGWNIYLIKNNKINAKKPYYYWYIVSIAVGTFSGIIIFILTAFYFIRVGNSYISGWLNILFGSLFLLLALFQSYKLYKKHNTTIAT
ncbi:MAG: hypothetical protein M0D57_07635 [Sphingobacteriales bacterium JAD_PAG50586_3]|nr:MAG: hypothetical protein M0D57_07635 [Sphingobacteriales bacterium JAD_PAG50586_3]